MITEKQIEARQENARTSQGPKTAEGKAASSRNALKFGFFSRHPLIPGEDPAEWDRFRGNLLESLAPVGTAQELLAERIVDSAWRLRRFPVVEAGIFTANLYEEERVLSAWTGIDQRYAAQNAEPSELAVIQSQAQDASRAPETSMGRAFMRDCREETAFLKLGRYQAGLERCLWRNLQALERRQAIAGKGVRKNPEAAEKAKLQNDLTEDLTVTDLAA